jgi:hypothetical protein
MHRRDDPTRAGPLGDSRVKFASKETLDLDPLEHKAILVCARVVVRCGCGEGVAAPPRRLPKRHGLVAID